MNFDFQYMLEVIPNLLVYVPMTLYIAVILYNKTPILSQIV